MQDACQKGALEKLALAQDAWENQHPIKWEETTVVDQAGSPKELLWKEAIHIWLLNPPSPPPSSTGIGECSSLDVGWLPRIAWKAEPTRGDPPLPVKCSNPRRPTTADSK